MKPSWLKRTAVLVYGTVCYLMFLAVFLYAIGFVGNILVPTSIDAEQTTPLGFALLVNAALLSLFAVQHSLMARPAFKRWWRRFVPDAMERSTYVLFSNLALIALFIFWQPVGGVIWKVESPLFALLLTVAGVFGWCLVLVSTFLINHFDLFGLRQVWLYFRGEEYRSLKFVTPGPYRLVRHPLYLGWLFAFWATPTMTVAHLLFALLTTVYILAAIQFEERDLLQLHGEEYRRYRKRVPMLLPRLLRVGKQPPAGSAGPVAG